MKNKILSILDAKKLMQSTSCTLVTGSFDFVHLGHLRFIEQAKEINPENKLVMILLSDESIKVRKGEGRPVFNEHERLEFASYIECIDYLVLWTENWEKLRDFVSEVKPNLYVINDTDSGIDNKREIVEKAGGKLIILHRDDDYSTSKIIDRIKNL